MPDGLRESVYTIALYYQDGPFWLTGSPALFPYTFRCIGTSWGKDRWRLHLAESDSHLPEQSSDGVIVGWHGVLPQQARWAAMARRCASCLLHGAIL